MLSRKAVGVSENQAGAGGASPFQALSRGSRRVRRSPAAPSSYPRDRSGERTHLGSTHCCNGHPELCGIPKAAESLCDCETSSKKASPKKRSTPRPTRRITRKKAQQKLGRPFDAFLVRSAIRTYRRTSCRTTSRRGPMRCRFTVLLRLQSIVLCPTDLAR